MFLNTRMEKPVVSDKDIDCFIYIRKYDHIKEEKKHGINWLIHRVLHKCDPTGIIFTKYYEPFRNIELRPGSTIKSKSDRRYTGKYNGINHYRIDDGFINAMLRSDYYGVAVPYKATIPSGTEFYVNNGLFRIASRKIRISKEKVATLPPLHETLRPILPVLLENLFGDSTEVSPGFYYMSDGTYSNPNTTPKEHLQNVCGIVSGVDGNKLTIMSLDEQQMPWCVSEETTRVCSDRDLEASGDDVMLTVMRNENYGDDFVPARWCSKYEYQGGPRGSWHMGSVGEVISAVRENMLQINLAIAQLGDQYKLLDCLSRYWTNVDAEDDYAYVIDGVDGTLIRCHKKWTELNVRPFMTKMRYYV